MWKPASPQVGKGLLSPEKDGRSEPGLPTPGSREHGSSVAGRFAAAAAPCPRGSGGCYADGVDVTGHSAALPGCVARLGGPPGRDARLRGSLHLPRLWGCPPAPPSTRLPGTRCTEWSRCVRSLLRCAASRTGGSSARRGPRPRCHGGRRFRQHRPDALTPVLSLRHLVGQKMAASCIQRHPSAPGSRLGTRQHPQHHRDHQHGQQRVRTTSPDVCHKCPRRSHAASRRTSPAGAWL